MLLIIGLFLRLPTGMGAAAVSVSRTVTLPKRQLLSLRSQT